MRKTTISLILLSIILMVSCNGKHDARISTALSLADSDMADSALNILNKIDRDELPNSDDAMFLLEKHTTGTARNLLTHCMPNACTIWGNIMR